MHANSYSLSAVKVLWYKVYAPAAFYCAVLSQYSSDVTAFPYESMAQIESKEALKGLIKTFSIGQNQAVAIKTKTRLADVIFEAKLLGFSLSPATLNAHYENFSIDPLDATGKTILLPLTSLIGVASKSAAKVYDSLKSIPFISYAEMLGRKVDGKKIFNKKLLEGLSIFEITEEEILEFERIMLS